MNIRALERSEIKIISVSKLEALVAEMPSVNQIRANLAELYFTLSSEHSAHLAILNATVIHEPYPLNLFFNVPIG
ncbi:hypothetical protein NF867_06975 [Solitalea sp. MAHUQ-68]|uniref:Uncharacterized protein n=1 Tax=Solitalea agri TaxID=2953739 RepID=A0A9X2JBK9_9SPHI|nr:hypothetical protein [Solitalea agri]MCO4292597.1 hypothetical protein [Solitalea agri]